MCVVDFNKIEKNCNDKYIKGAKPFMYIEQESRVDEIPDPNANTAVVSANITFKAAQTTPVVVAAGKFYKWDTSKVDSKLSIEQQGDLDAPTYKATYETYIPGITPEKTKLLTDAAMHEVIAVIPDNAGNNRILGEKSRGATLTFNEQTNDKPGYIVKIEFEDNKPPLFYTGTF